MRFFLIGFIISKGGDNLEKKLRKYLRLLDGRAIDIFCILFFTYLGYF